MLHGRDPGPMARLLSIDPLSESRYCASPLMRGGASAAGTYGHIPWHQALGRWERFRSRTLLNVPCHGRARGKSVRAHVCRGGLTDKHRCRSVLSHWPFCAMVAVLYVPVGHAGRRHSRTALFLSRP